MANGVDLELTEEERNDLQMKDDLESIKQVYNYVTNMAFMGFNDQDLSGKFFGAVSKFITDLKKIEKEFGK